MMTLMPHCATKLYLPFGRFGGRAFGLVKRGEMILEHVPPPLRPRSHGVSSSAQRKQRCLTVPSAVFLHSKLDGVTLRLL